MEILGFPISEERKTDNGCWDYRPGYFVSLFPLSQWDTAALLDILTSFPCLVVSSCEDFCDRTKAERMLTPYRPNHHVSHSSLCLSLGYWGSGIRWKLWFKTDASETLSSHADRCLRKHRAYHRVGSRHTAIECTGAWFENWGRKAKGLTVSWRWGRWMQAEETALTKARRGGGKN